MVQRLGTFMGFALRDGCLQATVIKTLAKTKASCNHSLLPLKRAEWGSFGARRIWIWVDVSVSSRTSRIEKRLYDSLGEVALPLPPIS